MPHQMKRFVFIGMIRLLKYGLYLYTAVYRKLLSELLYLLRIQLLQQYPAEKADV